MSKVTGSPIAAWELGFLTHVIKNEKLSPTWQASLHRPHTVTLLTEPS